MRKWWFQVLFLTFSIAVLAYVIFISPNFFRKYDHSEGIAYFKQGPISIFPYEMDAAKMPFAINGTIKDQRIGNQGIFVYLVGNDSAKLEFKINQTIYRYIQKLDEETSNDFFSSKIHLTDTPQPPNYHGLYYFKLLRTIGFYSSDSKKSSPKDISDSCPFNVSVINKTSSIINVPIFIKLLSDDRFLMSFSVGGHYYDESFIPGSIIKNPYFSISVKPYGPVTEEQKKKVYFFKFER